MNRPAFKNSELGLIPADWEVKRFDDVYSFAAAGDLQKGFYSPLKDSIHKYCIYSNGLSDKGLYGYTSHPRYKQNAITITGRGTLGHAEYRVEDFDAIIRLLILTPKGEVDNQFIVYWINYLRPFKHESTSIPQLTVPQVACTSLPFPPLPEQRRIAAALSDADAWIESLDKLIEKKKLVKQGAMQALLSGKTRLPGFSGKWVEREVKSMLSIGHGKDYKELNPGDVPVYGSGGYMCSVAACLYDGPTVCIGRKGTIDKPFYHEGPIWTVDTLFYTHSFVEADPKFVYYAFQRVDWLALNMASGVPSLTAKSIEQILLEVPPTFAEQTAIAAVLSDMDAELAALSREKAKAEQIKQGMMQELLTGRVRLAGGE